MNIPSILKNQRLQIVAGAWVGTSLGFAAGYIYGKRQGSVTIVEPKADTVEVPRDENQRSFDDLTEEERHEIAVARVESAKERERLAETYGVKEDELPEGDVLIFRPRDMLPNVTEQEQAVAYDKIPTIVSEQTVRQETEHELEEPLPLVPLDLDDIHLTPEREHRNVFAGGDDDGWVYENEQNTRDPEKPYVIHKDEFFSGESGFRQGQCTYYAGDNVMTNELETVVANHGPMFGDLRWGHGSGDPTVVYIRNEKLSLEWEVILHTGHYAYEVMGLEADEASERELRHSHSSVLKYRE